jgi:hypothetical protein
MTIPGRKHRAAVIADRWDDWHARYSARAASIEGTRRVRPPDRHGGDLFADRTLFRRANRVALSDPLLDLDELVGD